MTERHSQDVIDVHTVYTYGMSNVRYVNIIIKVALIKSLVIHLLEWPMI